MRFEDVFAYLGAGILLIVAGVVFLVEGEMGAALPVFMMLFGLIYLGAGVGHLRPR